MYDLCLVRCGLDRPCCCMFRHIYIYIYKRSFDFANCVSRLYLQLWSLQIDKEMIRGRFIQLLLRFD